MIRRIKIWHFALLMLLTITFLRFEELIVSIIMFWDLILLITFHKTNIYNLLNDEIINQFVAVAFLFFNYVFIFIYKVRHSFLKNKISISQAFVIILYIILTLCPLIAPFNPNLQFNLPMAKNLSPLSSRYLVESINEKKTNENIIEEYVGLKVKINREFVDEHFYLSDYEIVPDSNYQALHTQKIIFLLGTDEYGRDVFSRLIYATRLSLFIGVCSVLITLVIGLLLGFLSGYMGGLIDLCLNRLTETFLAFPSIFLVILFLAIFGNSLWNVVILLGLAGWMSMFKVIRGEVIFLKLKNHLITSKKMGMNLKDLLSKEFLPLLFPSILTNLTFQLCNVIIAESALSFLGLTGNGFYPTWGGMIQEGQYYLSQAWWISFFPSIFLITTLQIFNNYGRMLESTKI